MFVLFSGYYSYKKNEAKIIKPLLLLIEVIVVRIVFTIGGGIVGIQELNAKRIISSFLPLNYYVVLYSCLYCLTPFINIIISELKKNGKLKELFLLIVLLFSVFPFILDTIQYALNIDLGNMSTIAVNGSGFGHTIVNFTMMYIIGACVNSESIPVKRRNILIAIPLLLIGNFVLLVISVVNNYDITFVSSYCNPINVSMAIFLFLLFRSIRIHDIKIIRVLSESSLMVYLTHGYIIGRLGIAKIASGNVILLVGHVIVTCIVLYIE